jgi:hydrogenase maturation protein HypF
MSDDRRRTGPGRREPLRSGWGIAASQEGPTGAERARIVLRGAVQGVGFRPFTYRLATELGLFGWVLNSAQGVFIEVEGERARLDQFLLRLQAERPARAVIQSLEPAFLDPVGYDRFEVRFSAEAGAKTALILPDIATCPACLAEILDPQNRRYLYPFTTCTDCGPRFSIIEALPYDRANTSMKRFAMCRECEREYRDPGNRRFHAEPNACPACGPQLELWDPAGVVLSGRQEALSQAAEAVRAGQVLALKGLGGFQLLVDARSEQAVQRLRQRKHREEKPLALMFPSLDAIKRHCEVSPFEERLLLAPEAPIVLLRRRHPHLGDPQLAPCVAPWNPNLGAMLPYTPLHHLLLRELDFPVVATSGNLSDEPLCTDEREALERLQGIADIFLVHDRPIVRHVDDSVVRVVLDRELVMRRARGYAPLPVLLKSAQSGPRAEPPGQDVTQGKAEAILAVGAHLKNAVALAVGPQVFISQHIGDLETRQANAAFCRVVEDLQRLYDVKPGLVACDLHPDYLSTKHAAGLSLPVLAIQHHYAHVAACMAENELEGSVLGVSWDGTGYGTDGTIWGGEFLLTDETSFARVAHWRQFGLPGGEAAIKEPRRVGLGLLFALLGAQAFERQDLFPVRSFSDSELPVLRQMLERGLQSPVTSSVGRLFDAVASLVGLRQRVRFEGQAAMELEFSIESDHDEAYPLALREGRPLIVDWEPMIHRILQDLEQGATIGVVAALFHNTLVEAIVQVARKVQQSRIVLTGGCFQNRYLTERAVRRLREAGFKPYWHQRVPPNDGGIALGQIAAAMRGR